MVVSKQAKLFPVKSIIFLPLSSKQEDLDQHAENYYYRRIHTKHQALCNILHPCGMLLGKHQKEIEHKNFSKYFHDSAMPQLQIFN